MDFGKIECFLSVARNLSFSRAADELYLSQSNVTMKISAMEKELGFRLFSRNRRNVVLTDAGAYLYDKWNVSFNEMQSALFEARERSEKRDNRFHIGFHGPIEWGGLYRYIADFKKRYPEAEITMRVEGMGTLKNLVLEKQLDLAILETTEIGSDSHLESIYIGRGYSAVALPKNHPLTIKTSLRVEDLVNETVIMADNTYAPRSIANIHMRMGRSGVDMTKARLVDHFENALAMCAAGLGVVFLPRPFKTKVSQALEYRDVDIEEMYLDYSFLWHKENESPYILAFIQFLKENAWTLE